ncbi:MAG: SemiSWEET transporter [Candidatus Woesearchaeota archaeon]|nr:SemiSWEET transporter [Candidatus Woesearchaeota archaeon]
MMPVELIGFTAGFCTTLAFVPQVLKTVRTKSTKDISLGMFSLTTLGVFLWLVYGVLIGSYPVILANIVTLILAATILVCKIRYG